MRHRFFILLLGFCLATSFSCNKEAEVSSCIDAKIDQFNPSCNQGASVKEYKFMGEFVYVFSHGNCGADMVAAVYDSNCFAMGALGGITGNTDINGVSFSTAIYTRTIWEN